ncbi:MAG: putative metal-dependent hydrolase of the TIM-barrel fold [Phycisphaerales bacterium]|nr:putative metal-dependent hydrolase of the TIM-barrel fold [Phycisphaerales bacterium]
MPTQVFANHAHVFPAAVNPDGTADRLLRLMDACGIAEQVCFAPFAAQVAGLALRPNDWLAKEIAARPRLHGFGTVDFRGQADPRPIRDQVKHARDLGLRGLKLHPNVQEFDILAPEATEAYAAAQEFGLFVTFHSGVHAARLADYRVVKFDEVAERFPDLRFSLEHMGGYSFFNEALAVIVNRIPFPPVPGRRCMVYGGLTSVFTPDYCRFWYMPRDRLVEAVAQATPDQLIFGLDFPYNKEENTLTGLRTLRELGLPERDLAKILGGNLREALGLAPPAPAAATTTAAPPGTLSGVVPAALRRGT